MRKLILLIFLIWGCKTGLQAQKVGLVLSGGGADALAHIGVIKALEENNIPIDFITGTSMGAMIGALYASGVPIQEIEAYFTSSEFYKISKGEIPQKFHYYYPIPEPNSSMVSLKFKKNSNGYGLLFPSRVISSEAFDFDALKIFALAEKLANYNFDNLKIPFRCVAADLVTKELVVFKEGNLTEALRASMSYPFFIRPIKINGHLMFDGGIYNNFPVDIMCDDFKPDFIIGSNVSTNAPDPEEDDLLGQLQSILVNPTDYSIYCTEGELIEPTVNYGVFDFGNAQSVIDSGYAEALRHIQHLKYHVNTTIDLPLNNAVNPHLTNEPIIIGEIIFEGINEQQAKFTGTVLRHHRKKNNTLTLETFERNYYRLFQESYVEHIRAKLIFNESTQTYDAIVHVSPIKSFTLDLGGNIASRPITEGYAGFTFNNMGSFGFKSGIAMQYGKMYQALNIYTQFDFPSRLPVYIKPKLILHNWNWFESRQANLFVTDKPNYIIEGEMYTGVEIGTALGNRLKLSAEVSYLQMESNYYQTKDFIPTDTTDVTQFNAINTKFVLSSNTLNKRQYAYQGMRMHAQATFINGNEYYQPGSTSNSEDNTTTHHSFVNLNLDLQKYLRLTEKLRFGMTLSGAFSGMGFFKNYTSTVIQSPSFKPTPDSKTLFLESFHANKYVAVGMQWVYLPRKNFQLRAEAYVFQPYQSYIINQEGEIALGTPFADRFAILSGVISYETIFGPLSFSVNYYYNNPDISPEDEAPVTMLLNFGYILFNKSAYH